jgi:hypothetical protein
MPDVHAATGRAVLVATTGGPAGPGTTSRGRMPGEGLVAGAGGAVPGVGEVATGGTAKGERVAAGVPFGVLGVARGCIAGCGLAGSWVAPLAPLS